MGALKTACAAAAALAVAACATFAPEARIVPPSAAFFDLDGRVRVSYDGRVFSSAVRWQHAPGRDEIWLLSPMGQTLAYIVSDEDGATLATADRQRYRAASVERLTRQALGWELPLAHLQYWVQGQAAPASAPEAVERDAQQRLVALTQEGWRIVFTPDPRPGHAGLPQRLDLAGGSYEIRLVIDGWRREAGTP